MCVCVVIVLPSMTNYHAFAMGAVHSNDVHVFG